jgi:AmmeMemoRadiSam system protein A
MAETLSREEKEALLRLARGALRCAASGEEVVPADLSALPPRLRGEGASFVTLLGPDDALRGCIGTVEAHRPLAHDVQRNTVGSALRDPRFPPVGPAEVDGLQIELSILTAPQLLDFDGAADLLAKIRPGVDGIIIDKGWHRATLLPSVWEKISDPVQFLDILCLKAGLPEDEWRRPGMTVRVYQALKVKEDETSAINDGGSHLS